MKLEKGKKRFSLTHKGLRKSLWGRSGSSIEGFLWRHQLTLQVLMCPCKNRVFFFLEKTAKKTQNAPQ